LSVGALDRSISHAPGSINSTSLLIKYPARDINDIES